MPGNETLARSLRDKLRCDIGRVHIHRFPDGESLVRIVSDVSGRPAVLLCSLDRPDDKYLPVAFTARTARELRATSVGLVAPYLAYMRQDKRFKTGEAISSVHFAAFLSGLFDWMVTVDPHLHRHAVLEELYSIPTNVVHAAPRLAAWIRDNVRAPLLIGPDSESVQWVSTVARDAGAPFTVLRKRRLGDRRVKVSDLPEEMLRARTPVLVDDIVSTARTMIETIKRLRAHGARRPYCVCVHGLFADDAYQALRRAGARRIVSTNSVAHASNAIDLTDLVADQVRQRLEHRRKRR